MGWQICSFTIISSEVCSLSWSDTLATRAVYGKLVAVNAYTGASTSIPDSLGLFKTFSDCCKVAAVVPLFSASIIFCLAASFSLSFSPDLSASDFKWIDATAEASAGITFVYSDFFEQAAMNTISTTSTESREIILFAITICFLIDVFFSDK